MVNNKKLKVKSDETRISEKLLSSFRKQLERIEDAIDTVSKEICCYSELDNNINGIISGTITVDPNNLDHTKALAYLKKHVR